MNFFDRRNQYKGRGGGRGGFRGGRQAIPSDDAGYVLDSSPSPQAGCFQFRRRTRGSYSLDNRNFNNRGGSSNILRRLGLPVRGGRQQYDDRKNQQQFNPRRPRDGRVTFWNRVMIPRGREIGREFILKTLGEYIDGPLLPISFHFTQNGEAEFYVESNETAEALKTATRRVFSPQNIRLIVQVNRAPAPITDLEPENVEILKGILSKRYNVTNALIDLSNFNQDPDIQSKQLGGLLMLSRSNVMHAIVKLISENCPAIEAIDLSKNRIPNLDYFAGLTASVKNVKQLNLEENQINDVVELEKLKAWNLESLILQQNPICNKFRDADVAYVSAVRKVFPHLMNLDGVPLPPPIGFDLEPSSSHEGPKLPPIKGSFFVNETVQNLLVRFIQEYYEIYDSSNPSVDREKLLSAYDDTCVMTQAAWIIQDEIKLPMEVVKSDLWMSYIRDSHNIKKMEYWERRRTKVVFQGRLSVVSHLKTLPRTKHDPSTFIMDVSFMSTNLVCLNVSGMFKEDENEFDKYFTRVFLLVPTDDSRVSIINDQLFISMVSKQQADMCRSLVKKAMLHETTAPVAATVAPSISIPGIPSLPNGNVAQNAEQQQEILIASLSRDTGMKRNWSKKCLEDSDWNLETAKFAFSQFRAQIPPDAFEGH